MDELQDLLTDLTRREDALIRLQRSFQSWDSEGAIRIGYQISGVRETMDLVRKYLSK